MANIFLSGKCNINCPYCFAQEFTNKGAKEFSLENVKKVINFIKTDSNERIGLIGGEPAIYPYFKEVISLLNNDSDIDQYIIYTNALEIDVDILNNKKILLLVNCNSPKILGEKYQKLKKNIQLLQETKSINFCLGINLYSTNQEYSYIFELLEAAKQHNLRFSLSVPNIENRTTINSFETFSSFKPYIFEFVEECIKNNIVPYNDCNALPFCLLNYKEKRLLVKTKLLGEKLNAVDLIYSSKKCKQVIDIFPDLTAIRCFGLAKYNRVSIINFKNLQDLKKYFHNTIDIYTNVTFEKEECKNCKSRLLDTCGMCLAYKINYTNSIKENLPALFN